MNNFLITALSLCCLSWISVSGSASLTFEVQSGEEVTLLCPNMSNYDSLMFWFRLINRTRISCISVTYKTNEEVSYCDGFQKGKFETSSNISTVFLKINQTDLSDSGLYFCGFYTNARPLFSVIHLNVKGGDDFDDDVDSKSIETLMSMILGTLTVVLVVVIIALLVKIWKIQKADDEEKHPRRCKNLDSDDLNYATMTFGPKPRRRELESNVVYAATR